MSTFANTFKPQDIDQEVDEFGRPIDVVQDSVDSLEATSSTATPMDAPLSKSFQAIEEEVEEEEELSPVFREVVQEPTEVEEELSSAFSRVEDNMDDDGGEELSSAFTATEQVDTSAPQRGSISSLLPSTIEVGMYTQDDMIEDKYFDIAYDYMVDRYGIQAVEGESREVVVDKFLNNRRANVVGNSVRALSEADYLYEALDDPERLMKAGRAYALFEGMAGAFSDQATWSETGETVLDMTRSIVLDPINLVTLGLGKIFGGTATKAASKGFEYYATKEVLKQVAQGATTKTIKANSKKIYATGASQASAAASAEVLQFATTITANKGLSRLATTAGIREVAATTLVDAVASTGTEFLYQRSLLQTGVQDSIDKQAVGLAAIASLGMGGVAAVNVVKRGFSDTALVDQVVKTGDPKKVAEDLRESMRKYFTNDVLDDGTSWSSKVKDGGELDAKDTDFFIDIILGVNEELPNGDVVVKLKGLAQVLQENGNYFVKRDEDDKMSNYLSDFISKMTQEDVTSIVKTFESASGVKLTGLDNITPKGFGDAFAKKMSNQARGMNSVSQAARRLGVDLKDMNVEKFLEEAVGLNMIKDSRLSDKIANSFGTKLGSAITSGQNRFIRTLVSHPSTTLLNVMGWGVSSGLGSLNDVSTGLFHLGQGAVKSLVMGSEAGARDTHIAKALIGATANRVNLLLDSDMTQAAFKSALERNSGALETFNRVQAGGVDVAKSVEDIIGTSKLGRGVEGYVNGAQTATFVHAQDVFTKSQEYVFQMDKRLRVLHNKSWNEFYSSPDAAKMMSTREYKDLELGAVSSTLEHTFSQSYKGKGAIGEIAGFIEDARNLPGIGMLVPFGRFFNNTVDFAAKNTPGLNVGLKYLGGKYPTKTYKELHAQGLIAGGLVYSLMGNEQEKRKQGLGTYDSVDPLTGEVFSQQFDYPLSLFIGVARLMSFTTVEDSPPEELITQLGKDFAGGGLTRNVSMTGGVLIDALASLAAGELEKSGDLGKQVAFDIGAQLVGGFTRPLEPLDALVGMVAGTEMQATNTKDGNIFINKSLGYISNTAQILMGGPVAPVRVSAAEGEADLQTTKNTGIRVERLTNTLRVMNMIGINSWDENAEYRTAMQAPGAANEYNRMFFQQAELVATRMMASSAFRDMPLEQQRTNWKAVVTKLKEQAKFRLAVEYTGAQSTLAAQISITTSKTADEIKEQLKELGFTGGLGDLTTDEMSLLESSFDHNDFMDAVTTPMANY